MIYKIFKKYFLKRFLSEQNKANTDDLITFVGIDSEGKKWYRPKEDVHLPIQRLREQQKYLSLLASKISPDNLNTICNEAKKWVKECVKGKDHWAKVASLLDQIQLRQNWIYAPDLILHVVASQLIREDEEFNPEIIDQDIHQSKVDQLDKESDIQSPFFFTLRDIKELSDLMNPSDKSWKEYKADYKKSLETLKEAMKIYS